MAFPQTGSNRGFGSALLLALGLAGCAPEAGELPTTVDEILDRDVQASDADRRAANLLSLGNNDSLQAMTDPYERAVSCIVSVEWLGQRMSEGSLATREQAQAIDMVAKLYRREGLETGKSQSELAQDLERVRQEETADGLKARIALSCLRRLT